MGFYVNQLKQNTYLHEKDSVIKTHFERLILDLGLACFFPARGFREHNKVFLLAQTGPKLMESEPHSVQSSFRFNLCSLVELEKMEKEQPSSSYRNFPVAKGSETVMLVSLENETGESTDEMNWSKALSLRRLSLWWPIRFSYSQIVNATRNFSNGRVLGRGACSYVFRGRMGVWRKPLAIKRLDKEDQESPKSFCRELMIANSLHNPNIVPLEGFCIDPEHDFSWCISMSLVVVLNASYTLCDFGLVSWTAAPLVPFLCKTVKGTFGYLAPEYFQHGKISDKTDVYAFGVVLLELITGRKPIEANRPSGEENLVVWAKPLLYRGMGAIEELLDARLTCTRKNSASIEHMIRAASACVINEEPLRPGMKEIFSMLKGDEEIELRTFSSRKKIESFGSN